MTDGEPVARSVSGEEEESLASEVQDPVGSPVIEPVPEGKCERRVKRLPVLLTEGNVDPLDVEPELVLPFWRLY